AVLLTVSEAEAEKDESAGKWGRGGGRQQAPPLPWSTADPSRLSGGSQRKCERRRERRGAKQGKLRGGGSRNRDGDRLPLRKANPKWRREPRRRQSGGGGSSSGGREGAKGASCPPHLPLLPPHVLPLRPPPSPDSGGAARTPARTRQSVSGLVAPSSHQPPPSAASRARQLVRSRSGAPPRVPPHFPSAPVKPAPARTLARTFSGASPRRLLLLFFPPPPSPPPLPPTAARAAAAAASSRPPLHALHPSRVRLPQSPPRDCSIPSAAGAGEKKAGGGSQSFRLPLELPEWRTGSRPTYLPGRGGAGRDSPPHSCGRPRAAGGEPGAPPLAGGWSPRRLRVE
ncbi:hypothetical protein J0S82_016839, partial [Galemys pyrenaicus]